MSLQSWMPQVISHVFWYRKKAFQLKVDTYAEWVMFAVQAGSFRYRIGEAAGAAGFGEAVLCPPGTAFHREVIEPVTFHFYTLCWQRVPQEGAQLERGEPAAVSDSASALAESMEKGEGASMREAAGPAVFTPGSPGGSFCTAAPPELPGHLIWHDHHRLSSTYYYMEQLARLRPEAPKQAQWSHFLHDLWQQYGMEQEVLRQAERRKEQDALIQEAERLLRQQAFEPLMLKELSIRLGLSPVQFTRKFQAAYGVSPMDYLTSLRMQRARTLLLETDMTLEQIAEQCGYENGFYLSRVFSKTMKISPSHYRNKHRL